MCQDIVDTPKWGCPHGAGADRRRFGASRAQERAGDGPVVALARTNGFLHRLGPELTERYFRELSGESADSICPVLLMVDVARSDLAFSRRRAGPTRCLPDVIGRSLRCLGQQLPERWPARQC